MISAFTPVEILLTLAFLGGVLITVPTLAIWRTATWPIRRLRRTPGDHS